MSTEPRRRRWAWIIAVAAVLTLASGATLVLAFPSIAATTCPRCYGLVPVEDGLYAERDVSDADRQRLVALHREANQRVTDFYEGRKSKPIVLACLTPECYRRIGGGGERGVAVGNQAVMLSPRGIDPAIAAHELSHVELHARLGSAGEVPQWFDEGLAVLVSDDPRFLLPRNVADRCRVAAQGPLPQTLDEWLRAASADEQMYAKAACQVHRWAEAHGGRRAVLALVDRLNHGARFAAFPVSYS
ncbi:hypothetical protein NLX83_25500 [Allokutzneria sp. A3M-2-11 16]|uniref:hypothetical protein n=1 Tax=Allokutzneria sp. A3M-2-11 16 TaxID=2962043 RepID=UPI0020B740C0|nr:hypothetical protein [Allokutzneria sp. A3M-2-11 16]MCP3802633.1 hypothetical protein [Allokutzneria sp. A3M-2-11 16]